MKKLLLLSVIFSLFSFFVNEASAQVPSKQIPAAQYYEGGQDAMYKFINDHKVYPLMAKKNRRQGECIVRVRLEADGRISGGQVVKNIGGGTGDEALRVVKLLKFNAPGFPVNLDIPVYFKL